MQSQRFQGATGTLIPPDEWDRSKHGLPPTIYVGKMNDKAVTAWRPSKEEFARLLDGGWVYVHVFAGGGMPMIRVEVGQARPVNHESDPNYVPPEPAP